MRITHTLPRFALLLGLAATTNAWAADAVKPAAVAAASAPKAQAQKAQAGAVDCPKGAGETTGSTGPSNKGETGTQGGSVIGPKKPKCPQDLAGKVAPAAKQ